MFAMSMLEPVLHKTVSSLLMHHMEISFRSEEVLRPLPRLEDVGSPSENSSSQESSWEHVDQNSEEQFGMENSFCF